MRLRRGRVGVTGPQLILGVVLGVAGGIYIWRPEFERHYGNTRITQEELDREREKTLANFDLEPESKTK